MSADGEVASARSSRPADARFLTPSLPRRVAFVPPAPDLEPAWTVAGLVVGDGRPDLVVTTARHVAAAVATGAPAIVVRGGGGRRLPGRGYHTEHFVTRPGPSGPRLVVPASFPAAVAHAFGLGGAGRRSAKAAAVEATVTAAARGIPLPFGLTVATREPGLPAILQAAVALGLPPDVGWYLQAGSGDDLQRLVWLCFAPGECEPTWAVKSSRVDGYADSLVADEAGLALIAGAPPSVRAHVAESAGRFEVDGFHGSLERAAHGIPLHVLLGSDRPRQSRLDLVRSIGTWTMDLGRATALPPERLDPERRRLDEVVLAAWSEKPLPGDLVSGLPPLVAVAAHNDLGPWNILSDGSDFTVVDWESASRTALPLWDLLYFCTDALVTVEGGWAEDDTKRDLMIDLLAGRLATSAVLFDLLARGAEAAGVPLDAVGRIATLAWLHHGRSQAKRTLAQRRLGVAEKVLPWPMQRLVAGWFGDRQLGPEWPAFRRAAG